MALTIDDIKVAGEIPESFHNIEPGCAVFYAPEGGILSSTRTLLLDLFDKCTAIKEGFRLKIDIETTSNLFLENTIVARRLNLGSLYRYNLLMARVNCSESVDDFVKSFFDLGSRDDEALKFINKKSQRPRFDNHDDSSFAPSGMLQMIVMRPKEDEEDAEQEIYEKTSEQLAEEERILQMVLSYADKYKKEVPREILFPLADGKYVLTDNPDDCKLIFTEEHEFWLKAGTSVKLNLTKLQKALYLLLLTHPKGIEARRLSEYREELIGFYYLVLKKGDIDAIDKTIDHLLEIKDLGYKYKMANLDSLCSKLNSGLTSSILNHTSQQPFKVQNTNGKLHVDLPRKFIEWQVRNVMLEIKE